MRRLKGDTAPKNAGEKGQNQAQAKDTLGPVPKQLGGRTTPDKAVPADPALKHSGLVPTEGPIITTNSVLPDDVNASDCEKPISVQ